MKKARPSFMTLWLFVMLGGAIFFIAQGAGPKGTMYQITVPKQGGLIGNPSYFCWLPESVTTFRCIIVHQHGCTRERDARQMMYDVQWTTLAKKWNAAFIACSLTTGSNCTNWTFPDNGSGNTYLAVLDSLARRSGHAEIKTIPWAIWGHSGGSDWITMMTGKYPDRIAVGVAQSCGKDISNTVAALGVPVLYHNGRKDICYNYSLFSNGRKKGAIWAYAINPNPMWVNGGRCATPSGLCWDTTMYGHAPRDLRMICIPWSDIALAARRRDQAGESLRKPLDTSNAWLGDWKTLTIASAATFTGNKTAACWFPNEQWAKMWHEYMVTGTQKDSTPPPAPYNLTGTYNNSQIVLKWDADADLQTGIKTFIIYRNGSILQTMQWPNAPTTLFTAEKGFQRWDDGDQPNPFPAPNMTFADANVSDTGTYAYEVSTVNWSGVAGQKSGALTLKRGLVTVDRTVPHEAVSAAHMSTFLLGTLGKRTLDLSPGVVDIFDIRGRLIKTLEIHREAQIRVDELLGVSSEKVLLVRNRALPQSRLGKIEIPVN
jgi:hypothetical protein